MIKIIQYVNIGDLVVTSPRELVEIPRTYVRFFQSFPEEDLCPMHEFSMWKAVEGDWLIIDNAGQLSSGHVWC